MFADFVEINKGRSGTLIINRTHISHAQIMNQWTTTGEIVNASLQLRHISDSVNNEWLTINFDNAELAKSAYNLLLIGK